MSIWLILFIASGCGMVLVVLTKVIQEKFGILLFWPDQRHHAEKFLKQHYKEIRVWFEHADEEVVYRSLSHFFRVLKNFLLKIQDWFDQKSERLVRLISGKQHIKSNGQASDFLYDIRSFKDTFKKD